MVIMQNLHASSCERVRVEPSASPTPSQKEPVPNRALEGGLEKHVVCPVTWQEGKR